MASEVTILELLVAIGALVVLGYVIWGVGWFFGLWGWKRTKEEVEIRCTLIHLERYVDEICASLEAKGEQLLADDFRAAFETARGAVEEELDNGKTTD